MTALDALKAHLNILDDTDDDLLTGILAAAITFTSLHVGGTEPLTWDTAPADLRQAIMMLAAHWYENREGVLVGIRGEDLPFGFHEILLAYRRWVF